MFTSGIYRMLATHSICRKVFSPMYWTCIHMLYLLLFQPEERTDSTVPNYTTTEFWQTRAESDKRIVCMQAQAFDVLLLFVLLHYYGMMKQLMT